MFSRDPSTDFICEDVGNGSPPGAEERAYLGFPFLTTACGILFFMPCYYGIARRPDGRLGQAWVDADRGRPTRQFGTGVTYTTNREAGEETGRLNRQTPILVPDGPLEEIHLAAAIRRVLGG